MNFRSDSTSFSRCSAVEMSQQSALTGLNRSSQGPDADSRLLIFQRHVHRKDERVFHLFRHIRVPRPVIEHQTPNQRAVRIRLVHHLHDLYHVQVDGFTESVDPLGISRGGRSLDGEDSIDDRGCERGCEGGMEFGRERSVSDGDQG